MTLLSLTSVVNLLIRRSPSHVARLVVAVIVDAVNAIFRPRSFADIFKKCLKGVFPAIAHRNPTPSVILVGFLVLVVASSLDSKPSDMHGGMRASVPQFPCTLPFACKAAATNADTFFQIASFDGAGNTTVAFADPSSRANADEFDYCPPTESLSGEVLKSPTTTGSLGISHDVTLLNRVALRLEPADGSTSVRLVAL